MQRSFPVWASCSKSCCVPTHGPRVQPCETEQVTHTALSHPLLLTASNRGKGRTKAQSQDPKLNRIWLKYNIRLSALTIASLMAPHLTTASQETSSMIMTLPPIYLFFSATFFFCKCIKKKLLKLNLKWQTSGLVAYHHTHHLSKKLMKTQHISKQYFSKAHVFPSTLAQCTCTQRRGRRPSVKNWFVGMPLCLFHHLCP